MGCAADHGELLKLGIDIGETSVSKYMVRSLEAAARDLSGVTESQILEAIRGYRAEKKRSPEITVGGSKRSA